MMRYCRFFLWLVLISVDMRAQHVQVTPEQTSIEWARIEKQVRVLMKRNKSFDANKEYCLYPVFWVYCTQKKIDGSLDYKHLFFSYYPRKSIFDKYEYAKCTVLISENNRLLALADPYLIQLLYSPNVKYEALLESYIRDNIDGAFYIGYDGKKYDPVSPKLYYLRGNKLAIFEHN